MTKLKFTDGIQFDTAGKLRTEKRDDGFYVVGQGVLIPAKDRKEAERIIKHLNSRANTAYKRN